MKGIFKLTFLFTLLLLSSLFIFCSSKVTYQITFDERIDKSMEYSDCLKKWTKEEKIYDGLIAKAFFQITYKHPEFVKSYLKEFFNRRAVDISLQKKTIDNELKDSFDHINFFMAVFTPDLRVNDFNNKNSIWSLKLRNDKGEIIHPEIISRLDKSNQFKVILFPYVSHWSRVYEIRFPSYDLKNKKKLITLDTKYIDLIVAGLHTKTIIRWEI